MLKLYYALCSYKKQENIMYFLLLPACVTCHEKKYYLNGLWLMNGRVALANDGLWHVAYSVCLRHNQTSLVQRANEVGD